MASPAATIAHALHAVLAAASAATPPLPAPALDPPVAHAFRPFSLFHLFCVAACFAWMALVILIGRSLRTRSPARHPAEELSPLLPDARRDPERRYRRAWGSVGVAYWLISNAYYCFADFNLGDSLPLHVCDLVCITAPLAMLAPSATAGPGRLAALLTYFWGVGLSTQGFFTPVLTDGPSSPRFWLFWITHTQIVGVALYLVVNASFRPTRSDLFRAFIASLVYVAFILPFDAILAVNYGYVGPHLPAQKSLVHSLGPWPGRALIMILLGMLAQTFAWLPFALTARPSAPHRTLRPA